MSMKNHRTLIEAAAIGIGAIIMWVAVLWVSVYVAPSWHKTLVDEKLTVPPGFVLVTNQLGQWRAAYADTFVILTPFKRAADGTRKQAVRRAQVQYEFDCERDKALWIKAE